MALLPTAVIAGNLRDAGGEAFNVRHPSYGAVGDGVADDGPAWNLARAAVNAAGGIVIVPQGAYLLTTAFTFAAQDDVLLWLLPGVVLTGSALPTPTLDNAILDWRNGIWDYSNDIIAAGGFRQTIDGWFQDNVSISQTDVLLTKDDGATFTGKWIPIRAGSLTGVNVKTNDARTAGTLTVAVFKNASTTGLTAVLDGTNTISKATTQAKDTDTFVAGDELDIRITTDGSWAPTTADIRASLEVET